MNAANTVTKLRAGYDLEEASAIKQVAKVKHRCYSFMGMRIHSFLLKC